MRKLILVLLVLVFAINSCVYAESQEIAIDEFAIFGDASSVRVDLSNMTLDELKALKAAVEAAIVEASIEDIDGYIVVNDYTEYARNPEKHVGEMIRFNGTVIQVMESIEYNHYRIALGGDSDNIFYVTFTPSSESERILENDLVTVFGQSDGLYTYETIMGAEITIPYCMAENITDQIKVEGEYAATRSDPAPIGATIRYDGSNYKNEAVTDFTITKVVRGDEAWQMVRGFNRYNDKPENDQEYVVVYIKAKAISSENDKQAEIDSYDFTLVSESGMEYPRESVSGITPELTNLYPGAENEGIYAGLIKKGDNPLLVYLKNNDNPIWFDLNKRIPISIDESIVFETLERKDKGDRVKEMQAALVEMGYLEGKPDGYFGLKTETAVMEYQKDAGLEETGIADNATLHMILSYTQPG